MAVYPNSQLGGDEKTKSALVESFSITRGGPLYWLMAHISISKDENRQVILRTVSSVLVTWLPLLVLSLIQGQAYGMQINIPFLKDLAVNARFLIAFPILTLAELGIDQKWRTIVFEFLRSGLVTEKELPSFEAVIEKTTRLRDRVFPEALMLIAAFIPSIIVNTEFLMNGVSNWHNIGTGSNQMSLAGSWFNFISTPFFRFLLFRWLWRMCIWTSFLWRVSRINLYLVATHADLAGGLDFISQGQKAFSPIVFAGGAVVAAQVGNAIAYQGATLSSMKLPMGPMRITYDFFQRVSKLPDDQLKRATALRVHLYGSLSATGKGHGTDRACLAGLLGKAPATCPPEFLDGLANNPEEVHKLTLGPTTLNLTLKDIIFDATKGDFHHPNTMTGKLLAGNETLFELEYYSVGGGFIEWKGYKAPDKGQPKYAFAQAKDLKKYLIDDKIPLPTLLLTNEMAISGKSEKEIWEFIDQVTEVMVRGVDTGLSVDSILPGPIKLHSKAADMACLTNT